MKKVILITDKACLSRLCQLLKSLSKTHQKLILMKCFLVAGSLFFIFASVATLLSSATILFDFF